MVWDLGLGCLYSKLSEGVMRKPLAASKVRAFSDMFLLPISWD